MDEETLTLLCNISIKIYEWGTAHRLKLKHQKKKKKMNQGRNWDRIKRRSRKHNSQILSYMTNSPLVPTAAMLCYQTVSCLQLSPLRLTLSLITAASTLVGENTQLSSWSRGHITTLPFPSCRWTNICQSNTV